MLRTTFIVEIAVDEATKRYVAGIYSVANKKQLVIVEKSLRLVFPRLKKALLQKDKEMRRFPLPEESLIVTPGSAKAPRLLLVPKNHNGH